MIERKLQVLPPTPEEDERFTFTISVTTETGTREMTIFLSAEQFVELSECVTLRPGQSIELIEGEDGPQISALVVPSPDSRADIPFKPVSDARTVVEIDRDARMLSLAWQSGAECFTLMLKGDGTTSGVLSPFRHGYMPWTVESSNVEAIATAIEDEDVLRLMTQRVPLAAADHPETMQAKLAAAEAKIGQLTTAAEYYEQTLTASEEALRELASAADQMAHSVNCNACDDAIEKARKLLPEHAVLATASKVRLDECPPGLFRFGTTLGFKSEYSQVIRDPNTEETTGVHCDAYVVASGEYFWGGTSTYTARAALLVEPVPEQAVRGKLPHVGGK